MRDKDAIAGRILANFVLKTKQQKPCIWPIEFCNFQMDVIK